MAESTKITHADMRSFVKYINFVSQNIILHEGEYRFNLQLDNYNPFARDDQPARARLADITHAMGITVIHSSSNSFAQPVMHSDMHSFSPSFSHSFIPLVIHAATHSFSHSFSH